MKSEDSPMVQLLCRVKTWCGIRVAEQQGLTHVLLRDRTIARFPSAESVEINLCGSIRKQVLEEPESLPDGVWAAAHDRVLLVDLTQPGGIEEAVRALMNCYIAAQGQESIQWWMSPEHLGEDPTCEKIAELLRQHREGLALQS